MKRIGLFMVAWVGLSAAATVVLLLIALGDPKTAVLLLFSKVAVANGFASGCAAGQDFTYRYDVAGKRFAGRKGICKQAISGERPVEVHYSIDDPAISATTSPVEVFRDMAFAGATCGFFVALVLARRLRRPLPAAP